MAADRWSDLERPPLSDTALRRALVRPGGLWTALTVVPSTGSTNTDLVAAARGGAPEGTVLVAEQQTAGRGRLGRAWATPARSALAVSVLLRPATVARTRWSWLPPMVGVAAVEAVRRVAEVDAALKWPNDVLVGERKLAGVLLERLDSPAGPAAVAGIGLNVSLREDELPVPTATSLLVEGAAVDRDPLLRALLRALERWYTAWVGAGGDAAACGLREAYVATCSTLRRPVRVALPGGRELAGQAVDVDAEGGLVVRPHDGGPATTVTAGDVVHVRPA